MYNILKYTLDRAKEYGVTVKPSINVNKKIDVIKNNDVIASIGSPKHYDFPHYIRDYGIEYANYRRYLYHKRHAKDIKNVGSNGWWASVLLW